MRSLSHPDKEDIDLAAVLYALGDPVRLEIVRRLAQQDDIPCAGLAMPVAKSTLSHHFKVLRESGVLFCRKEGTQHLNSLRRKELDDRFPGLVEAILQSVEPAFLLADSAGADGCDLDESDSTEKEARSFGS